MLRPWPICPRPQSDESLASWFERVGHEYRMSPAVLLSTIEGTGSLPLHKNSRYTLDPLLEPKVMEILSTLAQLPDDARRNLWPARTRWELTDCAFQVYCPRCCLEDLKVGRIPYGRRPWQQSWYTICRDHGVPLVLRRLGSREAEAYRSRDMLKYKASELAADRYRGLKVTREPSLRVAILGSLLEIERTVSNALVGIQPNRLLWGALEAREFLQVLSDLTTWALTHFEPVRAWSLAEDLTAAEEQEGYGLIGRVRRMSAADYAAGQSVRTLSDIALPKVRGSALWVAHALMSATHPGATDRIAGPRQQDRQKARILPTSPAARTWIAERQQCWPEAYRREWWIELS